MPAREIRRASHASVHQWLSRRLSHRDGQRRDRVRQMRKNRLAERPALPCGIQPSRHQPHLRAGRKGFIEPGFPDRTGRASHEPPFADIGGRVLAHISHNQRRPHIARPRTPPGDRLGQLNLDCSPDRPGDTNGRRCLRHGDPDPSHRPRRQSQVKSHLIAHIRPRGWFVPARVSLSPAPPGPIPWRHDLKNYPPSGH